MNRIPVRHLDEHELIWEAPAKSKQDKDRESRERWLRITAALKEKPFEWAVIAIKEQRGQLNKAEAIARLGTEYEVTSRSVGAETRLYARYTPKGGNN